MTCCCGSHAANCSGPAGSSGSAAPELDDLAYQAAADALLAIVAKLGQFRGESKFTTWGYKFVIFEVSAKIGRHFWSNPAVPMDAEDWSGCLAGSGPTPRRRQSGGSWPEPSAAPSMRISPRAGDENLTPRQRKVFVAIVLNGVPMDALVTELGSTRNAIYKTMFDARRKLRGSLAAGGYLDDQTSGHS